MLNFDKDKKKLAGFAKSVRFLWNEQKAHL
jgi:hypothetical protein